MEVKPYSSSIRVNGGPSYSSWRETTPPAFRPQTRPIPEFHPKVVDWRPSRRQCNRQPQDVALIYQLRPPGKENTVPPFRPSKRYISEYHPDGKEWRPSRMHLCSKQCSHTKQDEDSEKCRSSVRKIVKGPQYYSAAVQHGDVTFEPLEPGHEHLLPPRSHVSKPMAPQGKLNEYIIDGHFHRSRQPAELLTEQMAQFVSCTPWMRQEIFDEAAQASKENGVRATSVDRSITGQLYEDRTTLVNRGPWNAGVGRSFKQLHQSNESSSLASDAPLHVAKWS